jgi:hypothetical protein
MSSMSSRPSRGRISSTVTAIEWGSSSRTPSARPRGPARRSAWPPARRSAHRPGTAGGPRAVGPRAGRPVPPPGTRPRPTPGRGRRTPARSATRPAARRPAAGTPGVSQPSWASPAILAMRRRPSKPQLSVPSCPRRLGCKRCGTLLPRSCCRPACRSRWSLRSSVTRASRSRETYTDTSVQRVSREAPTQLSDALPEKRWSQKGGQT